MGFHFKISFKHQWDRSRLTGYLIVPAFHGSLCFVTLYTEELQDIETFTLYITLSFIACSAAEWKVPTTFIYGHQDWMNYEGAIEARKQMKVPCEIIRVPQVWHSPVLFTFVCVWVRVSERVHSILLSLPHVSVGLKPLIRRLIEISLII